MFLLRIKSVDRTLLRLELNFFNHSLRSYTECTYNEEKNLLDFDPGYPEQKATEGGVEGGKLQLS